MAARPERVGDPANVLGRADLQVSGDRVSSGVVQVVGPVVDIFRAWFDGLCPDAVLVDISNALGRQHTHHFLHGNRAKFLSHDKTRKVVDVGQIPADQPVHRHVTVDAQGLDVLACPLDVLWVGVQSVDQVAVVRMQRGCQAAVVASQVDDQPALDARFFEDTPCHVCWVGIVCCRSVKTQKACETAE